MKSQFRFLFPIACAALLGLSAPSSLLAGQLVVNGGFENGVYTSTISGNTDTQVPVGWTPNAAFDLEPGFNHVTTYNPYAGSYDLSIGNYDYQPVPTVSQTFSDVAGSTYSGSFYAYDGGANGDGNAYLDLWIDGNLLVALNDTAYPWAQYTFSFTGTGSDTLTIGADTNPSEWYVDNVSVTGATTVTPEPSNLLLLGTGLLGLAFVAFRKTKSSGRLILNM
jgi:hypothetical protein